MRFLNSQKASTVATGLLVITTAVWGFTFVTNQQLLSVLSVIDIMSWRFGLAAVILVALRPQVFLTLTWNLAGKGIVLGLLLSLGYITQLTGLRSTSATSSGFITGLFVIFAPLLVSAISRTWVNLRAWIAVGFTTVGLALLAFHGWQMGIGDLWTLACAFIFACHIVGLSHWSVAEHAYVLTTLQIGVVAISSFIIALIFDGPQLPPTSGYWAELVFLAVFATCLGFFAQTWAQSKMTATRAGIILTLEPVFSGIAGVTIGSDQITMRMLLGAGCILIAMYLVTLDSSTDQNRSVIRLEQ